MNRLMWLGCVAFLLGGAGCGGGADLSNPGIAVTIEPATLQASFRGGGQDINRPSATVTVRLNDPSVTHSFVKIIEDAAVMNSRKPVASFHTNADGSFSVTLLFNRDLAGGTYSGTLGFQLCKDQACSSTYPLTGNHVPYTLTVAPAISATASVNGVPMALNAIHVRAGDTVRLESSEPCWFGESSGGVIVRNRSSTTTSWQGQLEYGLAAHGETADLSVDVTSVAQPQGELPVSVSLTE